MALEFSKEFIEENKLSPEQVTAVTTFGNDYSNSEVADAKKEYDGKAHNDAQAILDGASTKITELTKVARNQGEKVADFIGRAYGEYSSASSAELTKAKEDYLEKVANFKGDEATKTELALAVKNFDDAQKKYADFDKYKETAEKYEPLKGEFDILKLSSSFGVAKPNFPATINPYEADAKWDAFKQGVLKDNTLEIVNGEAILVSKENKHITAKLKDLIAKDTVLSELMKGRSQGGIDSKPGGKKTIEGVPFEVPVEANTKEISKLIQDHLATKGISQTSSSYSGEFSKLFTKIKASKKT